MRRIEPQEKNYVISLMLKHHMSQRDISRETGMSRDYLRKVAKEVGYIFPRNGIEIISQICMCTNCGAIFRRPRSKIDRAKLNFCDEECKIAFTRGPSHPSWQHGKSASTFSKWIQNQAGYKDWRLSVLERDGNKCVISSRTNNLHVHHIMPKSEKESPEKALDVSNGITLNEEIHREIHALIREGHGFEESINILTEKYKEEKVYNS